ncbi:hypothetical protein BDZ91DRAFT_742692 [Kalaharituber pfeilii]|nr:hypothetical protein BDZ91DRAFT_742692 [Kalaharituber pfeilii]
MNHVFYITNSLLLSYVSAFSGQRARLLQHGVILVWYTISMPVLASPFAGIILSVKCYAWVL